MTETSRSSSTTPEAPRYASLSDYLRVIRRRRLLVALVTLVFTAIALGLSLAQAPTYAASAQVSFRDILADANIIGDDAVPEQAPAERAAANAELVTRPEVTRRVQKKLDTDLSSDDLRASATAQVGVRTNLVILEATASDAEFAAELANEYARQAKIVNTREERQRLEVAEDSIIQEIKQAREGDIAVEGIRVSVLEQQLSRVQTLKRIAEPVEIAARAEVPGSPVSPKPVRNTILGGLVGLVFGLLAAFLRDTFDRRLHTVHEIHEELGMPVVGRVTDTAMRFAGLARNGAVTMSDNDFEGFRVLRTNLRFLSGNSDSSVRSILVTSGLPEEGKSSVSMSLASAAALAGQRVLLIECDLHRPSLAKRLGISPQPGLSDFLQEKAEPQDVLQVVELDEPRTPTAAPGPVATGDNGSGQSVPAAGSFVCITAGSATARSSELLISQRFRDLLSKVGNVYDLVILDTSPLLAVVDALELVAQVEGVLVCVRVQSTTREQVRAVRAALNHLPDRPAGAVLTGLRRGHPDSYDYYYGY